MLIIIGYLSWDDIHSVSDKDDEWFPAVDGFKIYTRIIHNGRKIKIILTAHKVYVCIIWCACVWKNIKLYIFNIYTYILYTLNVSVFVQLACAFPFWFAHYTNAHHTMFFSALWRVKNKFVKLFLFVFIILVLYNIYIPYLFCFLPSALSPSFPHPNPTTLLFYVIFKTWNKSWCTSYIITHPIVIPRYCSVLPA